MQGVDLLALDGGLEAEVEVGQGLHGRQPRGAMAAWSLRLLQQVDLGGEELLDHLGGGCALREDPVPWPPASHVRNL